MLHIEARGGCRAGLQCRRRSTDLPSLERGKQSWGVGVVNLGWCNLQERQGLGGVRLDHMSLSPLPLAIPARFGLRGAVFPVLWVAASATGCRLLGPSTHPFPVQQGAPGGGQGGEVGLGEETVGWGRGQWQEEGGGAGEEKGK